MAGRSQMFKVFLIITPILIFTTIIILFPVLANVNTTNFDILRLFLGLNNKIIQKLYSQCEVFVNEIRNADEDQSIGDINKNHEDMDQQYGDEGLIKQRKKKKFINQINNKNYLILLKLTFSFMILQAYFVYNYVLTTEQSAKTNNLVSEYNFTTLSE